MDKNNCNFVVYGVRGSGERNALWVASKIENPSEGFLNFNNYPYKTYKPMLFKTYEEAVSHISSRGISFTIYEVGLATYLKEKMINYE